MSTISYLRAQLRTAEKRLANYDRRRAELKARYDREPTYARLKAVQDYEAGLGYSSTRRVVANLTAALAKEESRLYLDPAASL